MKKLAMILPLFIFLFVAVPALATGGECGRCEPPRHHRMCCPDTDVKSENEANVQNNLNVNANSGQNSAERNGYLGRIETGRAYADGWVEVTANDNWTELDATFRGRTDVKSENEANVQNNLNINANTGQNSANANGDEILVRRRCRPAITITAEGRGIIETGNAESRATAITMVNSNYTKINR